MQLMRFLNEPSSPRGGDDRLFAAVRGRKARGLREETTNVDFFSSSLVAGDGEWG